ncbi:aminopeptidase [Peribacillus frigoritolerans]|nr:aminopeptidase [Peribacillus frigoritolerans]
MQSDKVSWSIVAVPSKAWADKVFPEEAEGNRVDLLSGSHFQSSSC